MMEAPADTAIGLKGIRETMHLRHNPTARVIGERSFDVNGKPRELTYDPRWEVWDVDPQGVEYLVMTLEDERGQYKPPGSWLVELMNMCNPARYDGDLSKMIQALVDNPNDHVSSLAEKSFSDMCEGLADMHYGDWNTKVSVPRAIA
jgi:hypothetical protein